MHFYDDSRFEPDCSIEDFDIATMRERFAELGDVHAAIDDVHHDLGPLLELYDRQGDGEAPFPPQFPFQPGEPKRVQPSRDKDRPRD